jgi:hypothetical protein
MNGPGGSRWRCAPPSAEWLHPDSRLRPEPLDLLLGSRDLEDKILRSEAIERIEDHARGGTEQVACREHLLLLSLLEADRDDDDPCNRS